MAWSRAGVGQDQSGAPHAPALVRHSNDPAGHAACLRPAFTQEGKRAPFAFAAAHAAAEVTQRREIAPQLGIVGEGGTDIVRK